MIKADFDILYKNALRRSQAESNSPPNALDIYIFMDAIEMLANKLYPKPKTADKEYSIYDGLRQTMDIINRHFETI